MVALLNHKSRRATIGHRLSDIGKPGRFPTRHPTRHDPSPFHPTSSPRGNTDLFAPGFRPALSGSAKTPGNFSPARPRRAGASESDARPHAARPEAPFSFP